METRVAALEADVTTLRAAFLALLAASPAKRDVIAAFREEGRRAIATLQQSGVADVSQSVLMQARAKLLLLMEHRTAP